MAADDAGHRSVFGDGDPGRDRRDRTLPTKRALASYAGLTPSVRESAGKTKRGGIGHHGSGTLRWIMLQVAQVAANCCPAAGRWLKRLKQRKPAQVALIALARKLLTAVWALLRHGLCFDERVFAQQD